MTWVVRDSNKLNRIACFAIVGIGFNFAWLYLYFLFQGILGSIHSGKSALVHRYLTGSYMQEESPEGKNERGRW